MYVLALLEFKERSVPPDQLRVQVLLVQSDFQELPPIQETLGPPVQLDSPEQLETQEVLAPLEAQVPPATLDLLDRPDNREQQQTPDQRE
jgi:hypothetical protein